MDKIEMNSSMSSRRLRPPVCPYSRTTTHVLRASNFDHQRYSSLRPFQHNPAASAATATATYFSSQAGPGADAYQLPPSSLLSSTTHKSAGEAGAGASVDHTMSRDFASGSGCAAPDSPPYQWPQTHSSGGSVVDGGSAACDASQGALLGSSCYQIPPPSSPALDPAGTLGGGHGGSESSSATMPRYASFCSSLDTDLASVVGLPPLSSFNNLQASSSSSTPLLTQSTASGGLGGLTQDEYKLTPLPPSLDDPPTLQTATLVDLPPGPEYILLSDDDEDSHNNVVPFIDLDGPDDGLKYSGRDMASPPLASPNAWVKKETLDWSSGNTIANSGSSSSWMPQPYSSGNMGLTQAPWTQAPVTPSNFGVKKEAEDWTWLTSQLGKNSITSGGSSSVMAVGSKPNLLSSSAPGWGSGAAAGSSIQDQYKDDANAKLVSWFANGLFTESDIHKIMADKRLKHIVDTNPERVQRILNNRRNVEKYEKKKAAYLSDLQHKVELLQQENNLLSALVNSLQTTTLSLTAENNELRTKLRGFQQHMIQLTNVVNETQNREPIFQQELEELVEPDNFLEVEI